MTLGEFPLQINSEDHGAWTVLAVAGDLDLATAPKLQAAAERVIGSGGRLAVDLAAVSFVDSSGLRALLEIDEAAESLVLISPSPAMWNLLELTVMTERFRVVPDRSDLDAG